MSLEIQGKFHSEKKEQLDPSPSLLLKPFTMHSSMLYAASMPWKGWQCPRGQGKQDGIRGLTPFKNQKVLEGQ